MPRHVKIAASIALAVALITLINHSMPEPAVRANPYDYHPGKESPL